MTKFRTGYFDDAVLDLSSVIEVAKKRLAEVDFDTIVGTGLSGGIVVPALALSMGKKFVLIRKEGDDSHHGGGLLVGQLGQRWIFVDDFISSGRTRSRVIGKINEHAWQAETMVGQYMYEGCTDSDGFVRPGSFHPFDEDWMPEGMGQ